MRTLEFGKPVDLKHSQPMDIKYKGGWRHKFVFPSPKREINPCVNEIYVQVQVSSTTSQRIICT
jgi:hypothetical protein